ALLPTPASPTRASSSSQRYRFSFSPLSSDHPALRSFPTRRSSDLAQDDHLRHCGGVHRFHHHRRRIYRNDVREKRFQTCSTISIKFAAGEVRVPSSGTCTP